MRFVLLSFVILSLALNAWAETSTEEKLKGRPGVKRPLQNDFHAIFLSYDFKSDEARQLFETYKMDASAMAMAKKVSFGRLIHKARTSSENKELVGRSERVVELWYVKYGQRVDFPRLENAVLMLEGALSGWDVLLDKPVKAEVEPIIKGLEVILTENPKNVKREVEAVLMGERTSLRGYRD